MNTFQATTVLLTCIMLINAVNDPCKEQAVRLESISMRFPETDIGGKWRTFPSTQWTIIHRAGDDSVESQQAFSELLALYWKPIYVLVRAKGQDNETAKDTTQDFIMHLMEKDFPKKLDKSKGRFRSYLRRALENFIINRAEYNKAQKRGGGMNLLSLDYNSAETSYRIQVSANVSRPDEVFDREWAYSIFHRSIEKLRSEMDSRYGENVFRVLQEYFRPTGSPLSNEETAVKIKMSANHFKVFLHRMRARLRDLIRAEIRATVSHESEVQQEMAELLKILTSPRPC